MKLNIGVIFGGKSVEHDMSIISALQAMNNIDTDKYDITPIYITKDNIWYTGGCLRYIETFKDYDLISDYAKESVDLMKSIGLIEGYNNEFRPLDNLTRAEASKIIFELLKLTNIQ